MNSVILYILFGGLVYCLAEVLADIIETIIANWRTNRFFDNLFGRR